LQLRGAPDAARKSHNHRGFFCESDALRPFAKLSLGGVGHELSINILKENCEITEGQKSYSHSAKGNVTAPKPATGRRFQAKVEMRGCSGTQTPATA
jgi:hypothetical protein